MGNTLDTIKGIRTLELMERKANQQAVTDILGSFQKGYQTQLLLNFEKKKLNADLATKGLRFGEGGEIERAEELMSPTERFLEKSKVAEGLLTMQEAHDAGLLTNGGEIKPPATATKGKEEIEGVSLTMPKTFSEDQSEFVTTSIKAGTRTMENIGAQLEQRKKEKATDVHFKEATELVKGNRQFLRTVALFGGLTAQIKGKKEEQAGELGLIPGIKGAVRAKLKRPGTGRIAAFAGQRRETSFALNSILTGQNRVIRGVIHMILETLPDHFDPDDVVAAKVTQSITNAYKLTMAFQKGLLSIKDIENLDKDQLKATLQEKIALTSQEQEVLDGIVNEILATPATKAKTLLKSTGQKKNTQLLNRLGLDPNKFELVGEE